MLSGCIRGMLGASDVLVLMVYSVAYLIFHNQDHANAAVSRFQHGPMLLDGRRLILLRWNPNQLLPHGNIFLFEGILRNLHTTRKLQGSTL